MTNASSTYLGVLIGAIIGVIIFWWIYYRQKKTTEKQDEVIKKLKIQKNCTLPYSRKQKDSINNMIKPRSILNIEERFEKERIKNMED